jgi:imidazolonepropionase-like amidohydrolase
MAGTDTPGNFLIPGFALHDELALLVRSGLTPLAALQAATLNPAKFLNLIDSLGTVEAGKIADLVLLDEDPLKDIQNTRKINAVIANGRLFDRRELDRLLEEIAKVAGHGNILPTRQQPALP